MSVTDRDSGIADFGWDMSKLWILILFLTITSPASAFERGSDLVAHAERVIDGDTLVLDMPGKPHIRFHGIDAPERHQECADASGQPYPCGERARFILEAFTAGKMLVCTVKDTDRYGRAVALCRSNGEDIGQQMVRTGWAMAFRRYSFDYVLDEEFAKAGRLGMWGGRFTSPDDYRREKRGH